MNLFWFFSYAASKNLIFNNKHPPRMNEFVEKWSKLKWEKMKYTKTRKNVCTDNNFFEFKYI